MVHFSSKNPQRRTAITRWVLHILVAKLLPPRFMVCMGGPRQGIAVLSLPWDAILTQNTQRVTHNASPPLASHSPVLCTGFSLASPPLPVTGGGNKWEKFREHDVIRHPSRCIWVCTVVIFLKDHSGMCDSETTSSQGKHHEHHYVSNNNPQCQAPYVFLRPRRKVQWVGFCVPFVVGSMRSILAVWEKLRSSATWKLS